jgi:hypothetical protein
MNNGPGGACGLLKGLVASHALKPGKNSVRNRRW